MNQIHSKRRRNGLGNGDGVLGAQKSASQGRGDWLDDVKNIHLSVDSRSVGVDVDGGPCQSECGRC